MCTFQVLAALNFYAGGCYQQRTGGDIGACMCQSKLSDVIEEVTQAINGILFPIWVVFPVTQAAKEQVKLR